MSNADAEPVLIASAAVIDDEPESESVTIELDADSAAALYAVGAMLHADEITPFCTVISPTSLISDVNGPLEVRVNASGIRGCFATRDIIAGEELFAEAATAWYLAREPGADGVYVMSDESGAPLATLPPWAVLRTIRDTLTLSPEYALDAEKAYARIAVLTAFGSSDHESWKRMPRVAPGAGDADAAIGDDDDVPPRAQLLAAIAQCNAFSAALPADSEWKRGVLWPALGRMRVPSDRERLFGGGEDDESEPFSAVNAFFPAGSFFNHSCAPNVGHADCAWAEGEPAPVIRFVARKDIACGEEALLAYVDPSLPVSTRRRKLLITYHFACACIKCLNEENGEPLTGLAFSTGSGANGILDFYQRGGVYPCEIRAATEI